MNLYNHSIRKAKRFLDENLDQRKSTIKSQNAKNILKMANRHGLKLSDIRTLERELDKKHLDFPKNDDERRSQLT